MNGEQKVVTTSEKQSFVKNIMVCKKHYISTEVDENKFFLQFNLNLNLTYPHKSAYIVLLSYNNSPYIWGHCARPIAL